MMPMSHDPGSGATVRAFSGGLVGLLLLWCSWPSHAASAKDVPTQGRILATYEVDLASFNLGEFRLNAKFKGSSYEMQGDGKFSLFLGRVYKSSGTATSTGTLTKAGPESSSFTVSFEGGDNKEKRRLSFAGGDVSNVSIVPPKKGVGRNRVPVTEDQLVDVLDPLSAAFLHARADDSVCEGTLPVFDGRLRFDLVLTPKRAERLPGEAPQGLSGPVAVCNVKFVPVGGYKPDNAAVKYLSQTDQIEAWLVRLPQTTLYVPYWIGVPTPLGRGGATLTQIELKLEP
jgi:hypothetical protein